MKILDAVDAQDGDTIVIEEGSWMEVDRDFAEEVLERNPAAAGLFRIGRKERP